MASQAQETSAWGLLECAKADTNVRHCTCTALVHASSPDGSCSCLGSCRACSSGSPKTPRQLLEAAIVLTEGKCALAYVALGRYLVDHDEKADASSWPQQIRYALREVEERCNVQKVTPTCVYGVQLIVAALVVDPSLAAAYDALAFLPPSVLPNNGWLQVPDGRKLDSRGLWDQCMACTTAAIHSPPATTNLQAAPRPAAQEGGGYEERLKKAPRAVRAAIKKLEGCQSEWAPRWLTEVIMEAGESADWLEATASGKPSPRYTGEPCAPLVPAAKALQRGNADEGYKLARAVQSGYCTTSLNKHDSESAVTASSLYSALALLDMDSPRADSALKDRDMLSRSLYLDDATELLRAYRDNLLDSGKSGGHKNPFDALYLLVAALVELQRAAEGEGSPDEPGRLHQAFSFLHPTNPKEKAAGAECQGWHEIYMAILRADRELSKAADEACVAKESGANGEWKELLKECSGGAGRPLKAMEEIMEMVGLEEVKVAALGLLRGVLAKKTGFPLPSSFQNYIFVGNPGTGKTSIAELWAKLLGELELRPSDDDDEQTSLKEAAAAAAKTAEAADAERLQSELREKISTLDLTRAKIEENAKEELAAKLRHAQAVLSDNADQIGGLEIESCSALLKQRIQKNARENAESLARDVDRCERELDGHRATIKQLEAAVSGATANRMAASAAASDAASAAGAAAKAFTSRFVQLDGGQLASGGVGGKEGVELLDSFVLPLLDDSLKTKGGVIFIDEAHNLDYSARPKGLDVIRRIVKLSDQYKNELTFILAGYEKDIETKVLAADPGLPRRFPNKVVFSDYSAPELAKILELKVAKLPAAANGARHTVSREATQAFGRRLARGAGTRGFGNGGTVLARLTGPVLDRWRRRQIPDPVNPPEPSTENMRLIVDDLLGPPPDPSSGAVGAIMRRLRDIPGIHSVKDQFASLVERMRGMYDADVDPSHGSPPVDAGLLNRAFLGGPGTFKTTVGNLYGELLAACGFLTDGEVVRVKPSDLLGSVVGESEQKTRALLERCAGKVLFIDEAYGIAENSMYGPAVLTTLVGELPDKGGADIAVVMAGYTDSMTSMFENGNPGLSRRFPAPECRLEFRNLEHADLRMVIAREALKNGLPLSFAAADAGAGQLVRKATLRNFGNAGDCGTFVRQLRTFVEKHSEKGEIPEVSKRPLPEAVVTAMLKDERESDPLSGIRLPAKLQEYVTAAKSRALWSAKRLQPPPELKHVRLLAPSGAGKSTCAELLARELYLAGVLAKPKPVIVGAESLQAGFVGQSSGKMTQALQEAQGGILFIDEAHNLKPAAHGGDFKSQVLGTLVAAMTSPEYKGKLLVVIAGLC